MIDKIFPSGEIFVIDEKFVTIARQIQGVCQVMEVREKSENSLYPLKSQGNLLKVGEYQGIFFENSNKKKGSKFR